MKKSPSNPSDRWFWNDYERDMNLRHCTLAAQGLWMRMLCIAARATPRGYVQISDIACTLDELACMLAVDTGAAESEIKILLSELSRWKVFGVDRQRRVFNRRMIREQKKREASAKGGKKGGRITRDKQRGIFSTQGPTQGATQGDTPPHSSTLTTSSTLPQESQNASHSSIPRNGRARDAPPFDRFWDAYPHKVGKGQARKAFPAAEAKTDLPTMLAAIELYIRDKPPDRPWANPATWLNGERWLDQPARAGPVDYSDLTTETLRSMSTPCSQPETDLQLHLPAPSKSTRS